MDYQKSKRQKRIVGDAREGHAETHGSANANRVNPRHKYQTEDERRYLEKKANARSGRYQDQAGERPMAQQRVNSKKPSWYNGGSKATASTKQLATKQQFEKAFGSKSDGTVKARNSDTGKVTEQSNKPSWYSGKKTKAKATTKTKGKNG